MKLFLEKPVYGGDCLARAAGSDGNTGKAIFVPLVLPGETVTARITEEKRSFAKAEPVQILTASLNRVAPQCPHYGNCGGCHYQHADYPTQLVLKQQILRETLTRSGVAIPSEFGLLTGEPWAYRNRIRLGFTPDGSFGYRSRRSHAIVPVSLCPVAAPGLLLKAKQIAAFLLENPGPMPISELELFTNPDNSQVLATLFCEQTPAKDPAIWLAALLSAVTPQITGIRLQAADSSRDPRILAQTSQPSLQYRTAGCSYRVDHGAFFQVNRWLIDAFTTVVTVNHSGRLAWDLFAGVGLFARPLTGSFAKVLAVESAPASSGALQRNLEGTTGEAISSTTLDFLRRNRQEREPRPDLILLDPPRAGLGAETTSLLNAIHAPEMVYVSCDPATLSRDLRALTQERYKMKSITLVDMFPQTFHIESVVHLTRS